MPNFIAKQINDRKYPFGNEDVEFQWEVQGRVEKLIYTKSGDEYFFVITKQNKTTKNFIIKGEKLTKPSRIGLLQKALNVYKEKNTSDVVTQATAFKKNRLIQKTEFISQIQELLAELAIAKQKYKKVFIEIGFGSGRHLLHQAKNNQDTFLVGIEVYKPSIEQVAKLIKINKLNNVRVINTDARLLLSLVNSNFVDKIFLHFPVPWDKAQHRRVVSSDFAKECERALCLNGNFELRTDSKEYLEYSLMQFLDLKNPEISIRKNENLQVSSKYEDRWKKQEKDIYDMSYTCKIKSKELILNGDFDFKEIYDLNLLKQNFKNLTIKKDDFFLHLEEIYSNEDRVIIKVAYGAFNKPEHCFIKFDNLTSEYFIKKPLLTKENLKAHKELKEFLSQCKK